MLSKQQVNHFETFGFLLLRQLYSADEMAGLMRELDEVLAAQPGNVMPPSFQSVAPFIEHGTDTIGLSEGGRKAWRGASTRPTITNGTATAEGRSICTTVASKS